MWMSKISNVLTCYVEAWHLFRITVRVHWLLIFCVSSSTECLSTPDSTSAKCHHKQPWQKHSLHLCQVRKRWSKLGDYNCDWTVTWVKTFLNLLGILADIYICLHILDSHVGTNFLNLLGILADIYIYICLHLLGSSTCMKSRREVHWLFICKSTCANSARQAMYTYKKTTRHLRESLLQWKSNKQYIFVCVCANVGAYAPYFVVICGLSGSTTFFGIIS